MNRAIFNLSWLGSLACALSACGNGGSGSQMGGIEGSGITNILAVTSAGAVTSLGSIYVNGVEFDLTGADITVDGKPAGESDLTVGDVVIVEGELDEGGLTGSAVRVSSGIAVAGPVSAIDLASSRFTVLGQTVEIDAVTNVEGWIDGAPLGGIAVGSDVEVSGFADSTGLLLARRVAPRSPNTPLQATGYVEDLETGSRTFAINGQRVDYGSATLTGFESRPLEGAPVRVSGTGLALDGALEADDVAFRDLRLPGDVGDGAQLQGWVTRFASETDFDVDGHPVVTTSSTMIQGEIDSVIGILRLDAFVDVKGRLIDNGVIEATEVGTTNLLWMDFVMSGVNEFGLDACFFTRDTAISIDGMPGTPNDLVDGDIATIHAFDPWNPPTFDPANRECRIITVEHNVKGPLESMPDGSIYITVMGQRVWLQERSEALEQASIGDIVTVSGHTTAEGDIIASSVRATDAAGGYRVIGFARYVDAVRRRFNLGGLDIDYADAELAGFVGGSPAEGDRVLVTSEIAPSAGLLRPNVVRYAASIPRGATGTLTVLNGLVTRFDSKDDFDIEGRSVVPGKRQRFEWLWYCDWSKVHTDLRMTVNAGGNLPGLPPVYWYPDCPSGRTSDDRIAPSYDLADLQIAGPVESIDLAGRGLRVGNVDVKLHPASLLTRYEAPVDMIGNGISAPLRLEDLVPGERAWIRINGAPISGGGRSVEAALFGDTQSYEAYRHPGEVDFGPSEMTVWTTVTDYAEPFLVLRSGIRVRVTEATVVRVWDCTEDWFTDLSSAVIWNQPYDWPPEVGWSHRYFVIGTPDGDEIVARYIAFGDGWRGPFSSCYF